MMIRTPTVHSFVSGSSEGFTPLNAFDAALLDAGIGNTNLLKVSSILPPRTREVAAAELELAPGSLLPIAYAAMESDIPGSMIAAAVAVAWPDDPDQPGLIMEYHAHGHREDAESVAQRMAGEGLRARGWHQARIQSVSIEHRVEQIGAVFAGIVLWHLDEPHLTLEERMGSEE